MSVNENSDIQYNKNFWAEDHCDLKKSPPTIEYTSRYHDKADEFTYLGLNENPNGPTNEMKQDLLAAAEQINRYPDNHFTELSHAVEKNTGVSPHEQIWGAGASDLIQRVVTTNFREGLNIISPAPTFWGYERVYNIINADVTRVILKPDGHTDVDAMIDAIAPNTGVMTFSTPANPSGLAVPEADIIKFATDTPDHILLLVDEVYVEYAAFDGATDMVALLRKYRPNGKWLILRSFSKAYAMAGARIGYGLASDQDLAARLENDTINFTVSSLAFAAALPAYLDNQRLTKILSENKQQRVKFEADLQSLGLEYLQPSANFISVKMPREASYYIEKLFNNKIVCAGWNDPNFPNYLRVALTNDEERIKFISALKLLLA
ncbi:MAG: aminotransferase class I/II-fold pyridoxal phosphate-dependent enzyme [Rhizobiales bacterium]|nr:aminotransferase class I/II-fold pyridoxal phosphate-dependent enzyme [Hyphomicrobiales bacterium]